MTDQQQTESGPKSLYQITGDIADINTILVNRGEFHRLQVDLERERMRLFACGVVAMADTPDSAREARAMHPDYESASCDDVKRRVDECIELRARVAELEDVLTNLPLSSPQRMRARIQRLEEMLAAVGAGGVGPLMPPVAERPGVLMPSRSLVDQVIRELARYCNTGEMDDAESLLAGLQLSIDPAQQPPTTEQSSAVDQPEPAYLLRDLAADIGVGAMELIVAIRDAGLGYYSVNMMLPAKVCVAMCQRFAAAPQPPAPEQPQVEQEPALVVAYDKQGWRQMLDDMREIPDGTPLYTHPQPKRKPRTDREIVDQTEELAGLLMRAFHQRERVDSLSTFRYSLNSRARHCWLLACQIQEIVTDTDPENAASELENGIGGKT